MSADSIFNFSKNPSFTLLGFFSVLVLIFSQIYAGKGLLEKPRELISPPAGVEHFTFGHRDVTADFFWIRAIQDFDYCDHLVEKNTCKGNSWLFRMLDTVAAGCNHARGKDDGVARCTSANQDEQSDRYAKRHLHPRSRCSFSY